MGILATIAHSLEIVFVNSDQDGDARSGTYDVSTVPTNGQL